jgi:hypothetical protein
VVTVTAKPVISQVPLALANNPTPLGYSRSLALFQRATPERALKIRCSRNSRKVTDRVTKTTKKKSHSPFRVFRDLAFVRFVR